MIYQMAGVIGINPDPFTWWELNQMATGKNRAAWWHTATLQAAVMNIMRKPGSKPVTAKELHPMEQKPIARIGGKGLIILKEIFCKEQIKRERQKQAKSKQQGTECQTR